MSDDWTSLIQFKFSQIILNRRKGDPRVCISILRSGGRQWDRKITRTYKNKNSNSTLYKILKFITIKLPQSYASCHELVGRLLPSFCAQCSHALKSCRPRTRSWACCASCWWCGHQWIPFLGKKCPALREPLRTRNWTCLDLQYYPDQ